MFRTVEDTINENVDELVAEFDFDMDDDLPIMIPYYNELINESPNDLNLYIGRCATFMSMELWSEAIDDAEHCTKLFPCVPSGFYTLL